MIFFDQVCISFFFLIEIVEKESIVCDSVM